MPPKMGVLLPTVTADGSFDNHFATRTVELAVHIRELLITWGYDPKKAAMCTSHSMKATFLSWKLPVMDETEGAPAILSVRA